MCNKITFEFYVREMCIYMSGIPLKSVFQREERSCSDCSCLIIFIVFLIGWAGISIYGNWLFDYISSYLQSKCENSFSHFLYHIFPPQILFHLLVSCNERWSLRSTSAKRLRGSTMWHWILCTILTIFDLFRFATMLWLRRSTYWVSISSNVHRKMSNYPISLQLQRMSS